MLRKNHILILMKNNTTIKTNFIISTNTINSSTILLKFTDIINPL